MNSAYLEHALQMKIALPTLKALLLENVVEVKFPRRRPKRGHASTRRMLCTNSPVILNSSNGRALLEYKATSSIRVTDPEIYNLIVTWDIFKRDFRQINMNNCDLITQMPADDDWWLYYYDNLSKMSIGQIETFYNT
jgi:hypothetical protein